VCPIGAIQNVAAAFSGAYALPLVVLGFFLLPLVFTLFFGRTFCGGVCPLGAVQDAVLIAPLRVSLWLQEALGLLAYVYLALAVLLAATGSDSIICQYDPFVAIFRLSGNVAMLIVGGCMLLIAVFIGRPYCRFLCPYGAVLRHFSFAARRHAAITPAECVNCRLCEDSCPFGAIRKPTAWRLKSRTQGKWRLVAALVATPLLVVAFAWAGGQVSGSLSRMNYTVSLSERIAMEDAGLVSKPDNSSLAFRATGASAAELHAAAEAKRRDFRVGGLIAGAFIGLVAGGRLVRLSVRRTREFYEIDRTDCFSCGRCFKYCPVKEQQTTKVAKNTK